MRVAVYLRQSLDAEQSGLAVARQRDDCLALCAERGWEPVEYVDNSVSASKAKIPRPAYTRMVADIAAGKICGVVAWDLDRLHRRPVELETFIDLADKHGLSLATVGGDADLSTDGGRLFARIKGAVSRAEIERKSARQKRAGLQRATMGKAVSSVRPFGFAADNVSHDEREAEVLRRAYAEFNSGATLASIAREWNTAGILTNRGNQWRGHTMRQVLRNPRNAGIRSYKGEVVGAASWAPIVDETTYRTAQARLSDPTRRMGAHSGHVDSLLSGIALCGVCGDGTTMRAGGRSKGDRVYKCNRLPHLSRSRPRVDALVEGVIVGVLSRDADRLAHDETRPDYAALQAEVADYRSRLDLAASDMADDVITRAQFHTLTERLRARLSAAETKMIHTDRAALLDGVTGFDAAATWAALPLHRKRALIDLLAVVTINRGPKGSHFDYGSVEVRDRA